MARAGHLALPAGHMRAEWWVALRRRLRRGPRRLRALWRRSLQLRVVTTTILLSLVVVALLGDFLVQRIKDGLLEAKVNAALADARSGTQVMQDAFNSSDRSDPTALVTVVDQLVPRLAAEGGPAGRNEVVLLRPATVVKQPQSAASSLFVNPATIPDRLRAVVQSSPRQAWTYLTMRTGETQSSPAVAVGSQVVVPDAGAPYQLYFLFPLDEEQATLSLVQRTLAGTGIALVLLVGAVAALVTRQVVTPVRMAARISERFAAGRLEERMRVSGEDDLARLAASFNKMATTLQRQIRQLEDLSRVQRRFVSDVSHELRTPLTTVRMAADVLYEVRPDLDPAAARSAEILQQQLDRFEGLLSDLLEISRYDAGAAVLETEPTDLRDVVRRVADEAAPLAARSGSELRLRLPSVPCVAEVDPRRIERILRNLVVNAIEHGEGRPVTVRAAADEEGVAVAVRDHGVGLRAGESALVFNRFWRADPARARTVGGSGLGLSIAQEDARLHGGWLQAWGEPNDGSQFRLTVPRRPGIELRRSPIPLQPADSVRSRRSLPVPAPYHSLSRSADA